MKIFLFFILLVSFCIGCLAQPKFEFGLTTQGAWVPVSELGEYSASLKNGFASGAGIYASKSLVYRFSVLSGIVYQLREIKQYHISGDNDPFTQIRGYWEKFPHHYFVIPVYLQFNVSKNFLVFGGIENAWLINYEKIYQNPEHNWVTGIESRKHKIHWSLSYVWNDEYQNFAKKSSDGHNGYTYVAYNYSMLRLSLSYPLWKSK